MSNLANVTGAVTNIAALGFTLGALGLTLEFVDRSFSRATPNGKKGKRKPIFDMGYNDSNIFSPMPQKKGKSSNEYAGFGGFFGGY